MARPLFSLVAFVVFVTIGFGWRTVRQVRFHGDTGWRLDRTGIDRVVGPLLALAFLLLASAPVAALLTGPADAPWAVGSQGGDIWLGPAAAWIGAVLVVVGGVVTVVAQAQMGASWRIGVQQGEETDLVTRGLFSMVRNPIFTAMVCFSIGSWLLVPNVLALAGWVVAAITIVVQVRLVEEPNLEAIHGAPYQAWSQRTGRFLPMLSHRS